MVFPSHAFRLLKDVYVLSIGGGRFGLWLAVARASETHSRQRGYGATWEACGEASLRDGQSPSPPPRGDRRLRGLWSGDPVLPVPPRMHDRGRSSPSCGKRRGRHETRRSLLHRDRISHAAGARLSGGERRQGERAFSALPLGALAPAVCKGGWLGVKVPQQVSRCRPLVARCEHTYVRSGVPSVPCVCPGSPRCY